MQKSICVFHNGNSRIVELYKQKFANLEFRGNWTNAIDPSIPNSLWEMSFADATVERLVDAQTHTHVLRHITDYNDDLTHRLPECGNFEYEDWLTNVVANNLCFADQVVSELTLNPTDTAATVIITTGRTANMHLQQVYETHNLVAFESPKPNYLPIEFFNANDAVFLWRQDQWQCLTSHWIALQTDFSMSHQFVGRESKDFKPVNPINMNWIETDWMYLCKMSMDQALLSKYICKRPTSYTTTDFVTKNYKSKHVPLSYNKNQIIPNYYEVKEEFDNSKVARIIDTMYNNVIKHLTPWREPWAQQENQIKQTLT